MVMAIAITTVLVVMIMGILGGAGFTDSQRTSEDRRRWIRWRWFV